MSTRRLLLPLALLFALGLCVWSALAHDGEHHSPGGNGQPGDTPLAALTDVPCVDGTAGTFPCNKVDLAALLPVADIQGPREAGLPAVTANEVWGWTDPLTGREYALVGLSNGVAFVDVTTPTAPAYLGNLPRHGSDSLWRSIKVYRDHLYAVSEAADSGLQVFDLTRLRGVASPQTFAETAHYDNFSRAHTIAINEATGFAYAAGSRPSAGRTPGHDTCSDRVADGTGDFDGRGLHVVDIRNPAAPAFAGCVDGDGYVHEAQCVVYRGPDADYWGREICFNANEDTVTIVDVTDKRQPRQLARAPYADDPAKVYTHQGWLTGDHARLLVNDELDEVRQGLPKNRTYLWDVSDLDNPVVQYVHEGSTSSIDHNLYVRGPHAFLSNYRSGVRVLDVRNAAAANLSEVAFFDVYPVDDAPAFNGSWSNYPFFASGTVLASGIEQGLFVLRPRVGMPVRIDYAPFFVRQHYLDFLNREPDDAGLAYWTQQIEACMGDEQCREVRRINVSAAFFLSIEFQNTGYLAYRMHRASYGTPPSYARFTADARVLGEGVVVTGNSAEWLPRLQANTSNFMHAWVQSPEFVAEYPQGMPAQEYVSKLFQRAGVTPTAPEFENAVANYGNGDAEGRYFALRDVVASRSVDAAHQSPAFVLMQYFGYLRRDPDAEGYDHWLTKLNRFNGDFYAAEMVKAFITSFEYRERFGN